MPEEEIKGIESVLTMVGGQVVYGAAEFAGLAPPPLPVLPAWSPVKGYGGYHQVRKHEAGVTRAPACPRGTHGLLHRVLGRGRPGPLWGSLGCECFAF